DVARLYVDCGERPGCNRRDFHRHLVGLDLEQIVARLHGIAGLDEPFRDLALGDGLAELRHQDVHETTTPPTRIASPKTPLALHARLRGRCRTASCRRTARPGLT